MSKNVTGKTVWAAILTSALTLVLIVPAWGGDKQKDEDTLKNAATVLQEVLNGNKIPSDVLAKSNCVIVLPNVKKFGVGVGASGGRGAMTCREGEKFDGKWSAPAMYSIGGASVGAQLGGTSTDFVLLVMNEKGVDAILQDKTKLGSDASAAAGPSGATTQTTSVAGADIYTYARTKGLFAGVSIDGATLHQDVDANKRLYGTKASSREIVRGSDVEMPNGGDQLVTLLNKYPK
jgi:lipid-binding SYLF domain-containing protein